MYSVAKLSENCHAHLASAYRLNVLVFVILTETVAGHVQTARYVVWYFQTARCLGEPFHTIPSLRRATRAQTPRGSLCLSSGSGSAREAVHICGDRHVAEQSPAQARVFWTDFQRNSVSKSCTISNASPLGHITGVSEVPCRHMHSLKRLSEASYKSFRK